MAEVYPFFRIFKQCVAGLNWSKNECEEHENCLQDCRAQILEVLKKFINHNRAMKEIIQKEILGLKKSMCYFSKQKHISRLLFDISIPERRIPFSNYFAVVELFQLPENVILFENSGTIPVWMHRASCMVGWVRQFFGNDPEHDEMKNVIMDCLKCDIPTEKHYLVDLFFKREALAQEPYFFKNLGDKQLMKKRKINRVQEEQQNPVLQNSNPEVFDKRFSGSKLNIISTSAVPYFQNPDETNLFELILEIDGKQYASNHCLIPEKHKKDERPESNPLMYFLIDYWKAKMYTAFCEELGDKWPTTKKFWWNLRTFQKYTGIQNFVMRSFPNPNKASDALVLAEDVFDVMQLALERLETYERYESALKESREEGDGKGTKSIQKRRMTITDFERLLEKFDIDKSWITIVPDLIYTFESQRLPETIPRPLILCNSHGDMMLDSVESRHSIFQKVIVGRNWKQITELHGQSTVQQFKKNYTFLAGRGLVNRDENILLVKQFDMAIETFNGYPIFKNAERMPCFTCLNNCQLEDVVSQKEFNECSVQVGLPELPEEFTFLKVWEACLYISVSSMCEFFDEDDGDSRTFMLGLLKAIKARGPVKEKNRFESNLKKLLAAWQPSFATQYAEVTEMSSEIGRNDETDPQIQTFQEHKLADMQLRLTESSQCIVKFGDIMIVTNHALRGESEGFKKVILDSFDLDKAKEDNPKLGMDVIELCLADFMNRYPDKNIYIRYLPTTIEKEQFFVAEEVFEIIPLLARKQNMLIIKINDCIQKYQKSWRIGNDDEFTTINRSELEKVFDELGLNKNLLTIVPDVEFEATSDSHLQNNNESLHYTNLSGNPVVTANFAVYKIFRDCVLGLNWNARCKKHKNCHEEAKTKIVKLMRNYWHLGENHSLYLVEKLQLKIDELKRELCFLTQQSENDEFLFKNYKHDDKIPIAEYNAITTKFHLPKNSQASSMTEAPAYLLRVYCSMGWALQFFGTPLDMTTAVVNGIQHLIPKKMLPEMIRQMNYEALLEHPEFFTYGKDQNPLLEPNQSILKMKQRGELRKLAIEKKKKKNKIGKEAGTTEHWEKKNILTKCKDLSLVYLPNGCKQDMKHLSDWKLAINNEEYSNNYNMLPSGVDPSSCSKYFPINAKLSFPVVQAGMWSGADWAFSGEYLSSRSSYMRKFGTQELVIRSFEWLAEHRRKNMPSAVFAILQNKEIGVFADEMLDIIELALEMQGKMDDKASDSLARYRQKHANLDDRIRSTTTLRHLNFYLQELDIDKSAITIIPDMIRCRSASEAVNSFSSFVITLDSHGYEVITIYEAVFHIFRSLVFGIDWKKVAEEKGKEMVDGFKKKLVQELNPFSTDRMYCFVKQEIVRDLIENLETHEVFMDIEAVDMETIMEDLEYRNPISSRVFNKLCERLNIPKLPDTKGYLILPLWKVRVCLTMSWVFSFYDSDQNVEGVDYDQFVKQKECVLEGLMERVPKDSQRQFVDVVKDLWDHWRATQAAEQCPDSGQSASSTKASIISEASASSQSQKSSVETMVSSETESVILEGTNEERKESFEEMDIQETEIQIAVLESKSENSTESTSIQQETPDSESIKNNDDSEEIKDAGENDEEKDTQSDKSQIAAKESEFEKTTESAIIPQEFHDSESETSSGMGSDWDTASETFFKSAKSCQNCCETAEVSQKIREELDKSKKDFKDILENHQQTKESLKKLQDDFKVVQDCLEKAEIVLKHNQAELEEKNGTASKLENKVKSLREERTKYSKQIKELERDKIDDAMKWEEKKGQEGKKLKESNKKLKKEIQRTEELEKELKTLKKDMENASDYHAKVLADKDKIIEKQLENYRQMEEKLNETVARKLQVDMELRGKNDDLRVLNRQFMEMAKSFDQEKAYLIKEADRRVMEEKKKTTIAENRVRDMNTERSRLTDNVREEFKSQIMLDDFKNRELSERNRNLNNTINNQNALISKLQETIKDLTAAQNTDDLKNMDMVDRVNTARAYLITLRKIKDNFDKEDMLKEEKELVEKLKTITEDEAILDLVTHELAHLEMAASVYKNTVQLNICKLKNRLDKSLCYSLPPHPTLSEEFMESFTAEMEKHRLDPVKHLKDREAMFGPGDCPICWDERGSDQAEMNCLNKKCGLKYHKTCALQWIVINIYCPYCISPFLDPQKFPALGAKK